MHYMLMHKFYAVAELDFDETTGIIIKTGTIYDAERLPVGVKEINRRADRESINEWWRYRTIPKMRQGIRSVLDTLGIMDTTALPLRSYGLSLSDNYWLLPENANVHWENLNYYRNTFSEDIGDLLFSKEKDVGAINYNSPDNTTDGYLKKRWKIINGKRCLIKGGSNLERQEPFNEVIASKIMDRLGIYHVPYNIIWEDGEPYSVCEDFVTSDTELVTAWRIMQTQKKDNSTSVYRHFINCCESLGAQEIIPVLDRMIVLDYIIANEDRHLNNFGLLRNSETLEWLGFAPIYDSGSSLGYNSLLANIRKNRECLLHCSVFIELKAPSLALLRELQSEVTMDLARSKISADRLTLRQKEGFLSVLPVGANQFGAQFERVLPTSSAANFYPFSFSGKTDPHGLYIGRDKYGTNILTDFDRRAEDKTTSNILILGNSGQGKSYLLKLILTNIRESGKRVICLDPEQEYGALCSALGGSYIEFLSGENTINPLEPKAWADTAEDDPSAPEAFRKTTRLSQHIAFLKDFFRSYKDFDDAQIDTIEILLSKLYKSYGITDETDYGKMKPSDYPVMEDFYRLCEEEYRSYDREEKQLYTEETLQAVCLGIHSMCVGAESKYFNGHTNIGAGDFVCFGVKGLMDTNKRLKDAMLFNILSYMSDRLLGEGNTAASVDELYLFLTNMTAIEYIRNAMKRVRKKDSSLILASQNIEDFLLPAVREYTKPLFSIPTHQFLFNAGQVNPKEYMDALQVEPSEFELIKYPERGTCLYRCGNERYLLQVTAPEYKSKLFGTAGGR